MGPSVKGLAFFFAGLTAAKPIYNQAHIYARQSVPAVTTSSAVLAAAASSASVAVVASSAPPAPTSSSAPVAVGSSSSAPVAVGSSSSAPVVVGSSSSAPVAVGSSSSAPVAVGSSSAPAASSSSAPVAVGSSSSAPVAVGPSSAPPAAASSSAPPPVATSSAASLAPSVSGTLPAKAVTGDVVAMVSGTARTCSVQEVTAMTTTSILTLPNSVIPIYTITQKPTLGCTCNDGWMAGVATSIGSDGLGTVTCEFGDANNPAIATVTSAMVPDATYVAEWCQTIDTNDPDALINLWENKNIAGVLDLWTRGKAANGGDGWIQALVEHAAPTLGNSQIGGCGVIGGQCSPQLDCEEMVAKGMGAHYWILQAVQGFHAKLEVAHEFLQDETINNILSLDTIASDFSAPASTGMNSLSILASLLSAGIFLAGSVTGIVGVVASEVGLAATAARAAAQAASRAAKTAKADIRQQYKLDGMVVSADKQISAAGGTSRTANALGAGLWTTASTFTMISAFSDPEGQVDASDLTPVLQEMFSAARDQIAALGSLATGGGGDYSALPATNGSGFAPDLAPDSYIAGFFSDGKFLLSESNEVFNQSIHDSYGTFKSKLVDQALQTGGLSVFALTDLDDEGKCADAGLWGGYGSQWMDPLGDGNYYCMQLYRDNHGGGCGALTSCDWVVAEQDTIDKLTNNYGFNLQNYYAAAAQCNKAQLADRIPDYTTLQADGITPACYYNINAQKAEKYMNCHGRDNLLCDSGFTLSNF